MDFSINFQVKEDRVRDLLVAALENDSWIGAFSYRYGAGISNKDFIGSGRFTVPDKYYHPSQLVPFHPDCVLIVHLVDHNSFDLTREVIAKGLQLFSTHSPEHFVDFVTEQDDLTTSDIFLQYCLFNEIIYY